MAKDIVFNVVAKKDSRQLEELALEFKALSEEAERSGKKINTGFKQFVDKQIIETKGQVRSLGQEFARTGDIDVFKKLRGAEKDLKGLENLSKQITKSVGTGISTGVQEGSQQGVKFLGNAFGSLPPQAQIAVAAGVAGAVAIGAPAIGAALTGALLAGVGAAGIGTAIAVQIKDPRVAGAVDTLKTQLKLDLTEATSSFGPVLIDGAQKFGSAFGRIEPALEKGFNALAGPADHLFDGIGKFVENLGPGFTDILEGAGVVIDEIAADLPELGKDFRVAFRALSDGAGGGADALGQVIKGFGILVEATGVEFDLLSKTFTAMEIAADLSAGKFDQAALHILELKGGFHEGSDEAKKLATQIGGLGAAAGGAGADFAALAGQLNKTTENADTLAGAMTDKVLGALLSGDHAALGFQESLTGLKDSFAQNGKQLDITTAKGQANREAILSVVEANVRQYDANIAAGDSAQEAAGKYDKNTDALRNQLIQAHFTKDQIDGLIGKYAQVPDKVNTNIALEGLTDALNNVAILIGAINGIPKYVKIEAAIEAVDKSGLAQNVSPHDPHRAAGGPVLAGMPYIVGEKRPELFVPNVDGFILPKIPPPPSFLGTGRSGGGTSVSVNINAGGGPLDTLFASWFAEGMRRGLIQIQAGAIIGSR